VDALGALRPTIEPRATEHIAEMSLLIERLVASGNAYVAEDHVLFSVPSMPDYGRLSKRSLDELIAGARVEVAPYKRDATDFVLWKPSKPGEPAWPSPASIATPGRPGWHLECSAMSWKHLGETFDIHGGGIDLVFPHHENEIAQSRCAFHTPVMANWWMHNGHLQVEGEKMSKSVGNFVTIRELLDGWKGRRWAQPELRLLMLSAHYRQPLDWTLHGLEEAKSIVSDWKLVIANVNHAKIETSPSADLLHALADDLNTPDAIVSLHNKAKLAAKDSKIADELYSDLVFLGLFNNERTEVERILADPEISSIANSSANAPLFELPSIKERIATRVSVMLYTADRTANTVTVSSSVASSLPYIFSPGEKITSSDPWTKYGPRYISSDDRVFIRDRIGIEELNSRIEIRLVARKIKNFAESDRIRDELAAIGVVLKDSKDGTTWEIAR
jgi:cysteinyl-tRNA synthetase